jgi:hypothetical protein
MSAQYDRQAGEELGNCARILYVCGGEELHSSLSSKGPLTGENGKRGGESR